MHREAVWSLACGSNEAVNGRKSGYPMKIPVRSKARGAGRRYAVAAGPAAEDLSASTSSSCLTISAADSSIDFPSVRTT